MKQLQDMDRQFCLKIVSGGQTGVDRAALDVAIEHGLPHGGWAPTGRLAEDGAIPERYNLTALFVGGYRQRNKLNVSDSDGTLILNVGKLDGGTLATVVFAQRLNKPCLVIDLDTQPGQQHVLDVQTWLRDHAIQVLNVAGPRESKRPGVYLMAREMLHAVVHIGWAKHKLVD